MSQENLCMVDAIVSVNPGMLRTKLDDIRRKQMREPPEEERYWEDERSSLEVLLGTAGINGPVQHEDIFDSDPAQVERRLGEMISTKRAVFVCFQSNGGDTHIMHVARLVGPLMISSQETRDFGDLYEQFRFRELHIFSVE